MRARNVILTLIAVVGLLVFIFIKLRFEPKKKPVFNRNPSRIEYTAFALCRMECFNISANMVSHVFRRGRTERKNSRRTCQVYMCTMMTKPNKEIIIMIEQCGTVANIFDCYDANAGTPCGCIDRENRPVSHLNINR